MNEVITVSDYDFDPTTLETIKSGRRSVNHFICEQFIANYQRWFAEMLTGQGEVDLRAVKWMATKAFCYANVLLGEVSK